MHTSAPAISSYDCVPFKATSKPSDGPASAISRALPFGIPSAISNKITSPSSLIDERCAKVPPICPAPIRAILDLAIENSGIANKKVHRSPRLFHLLSQGICQS